jgi:hypothetical protein
MPKTRPTRSVDEGKPAMRKVQRSQEPPCQAAQSKPNRTPHKSTASRHRPAGFPDRSFRELQRLGPAALDAFLDLRQIGRTA